MAYLSLLLLIRTSVCIDVFTGCMPPETAWDRAQRRSECELNFIPQSRVLKQWKKDQEIDTSSRVHNFSHLSQWTPKNGARTDRTRYLIGKAADRCLLKVGPHQVGHSDVSVTMRYWYITQSGNGAQSYVKTPLRVPYSNVKMRWYLAAVPKRSVKMRKWYLYGFRKEA